MFRRGTALSDTFLGALALKVVLIMADNGILSQVRIQISSSAILCSDLGSLAPWACVFSIC